MPKIWFITGTSRGLGREWAEAALGRGDRVAATARDASSLSELAAVYGDHILPLALDVTDRRAVFAAVAQAHERFGRLDVIVNNAGFGQFGMIEEISESEARAQFDTNFFGALWVTQGALPYLRADGGGHIIQVSSIGGVSGFANAGLYGSSKWALEGMSQALAQEVAEFGINVTLIEPGGYTSGHDGSSAKQAAPLPAYHQVQDKAARMQQTMASQLGDPAATQQAILKIVDAPHPPLRIFFGAAPLGIATADYESRLAEWRAWQPVSVQAQGGVQR